MRFKTSAALLALSFSFPAAAEVKSATASGFEVESKAVVSATPAATYAMLGRFGEWWDLAHSYSGKAANFRFELKAGGCLCEMLDGGGSVEHMRVVFAQPGSMLRLQGGLGPLQSEAATGTLTWLLKPVAGGTEIVQTYVAGGFIRGGADKFAEPVDQVLNHQLARLTERLGKR